MELSKKKLMGIMYPITIFLFIAFIYFALIVCPYFLNSARMFGISYNLVYSVIVLVVFHVMFFCIIYCYLGSMLKNPGQPPKFWVS
jgi:hypothetical protein